MRTTINIDDHLMSTIRYLAAYKRVSLGKIVSELIQKGLEKDRKAAYSNDVPVFHVSDSAKSFSLEDVKRAEDEMY